MKKLALVLLMGISVPYLSNAQAIIKIAGDVDAKMVKSQVYRILDYPDIHEPVHLYIIFLKNCPKSQKESLSVYYFLTPQSCLES